MPKYIPPTMPRALRQIETLGERLRTARLRREMTQRELAMRVGISVPTLAKLENGDPSISLAAVLRVLTVLGLDKDIDLLAKTDPLGRALQDSRLRRPGPAGRTPP
ncbi:helix-turn-helix domain-containing protein [Xanthomonas cannabis]|uniref:helix-turn-helix domain-containing protein n=1 Tax=Xanthomonas cannabis TaxID=1885674 RepID=UPI001FBBDDA4|nr:helix-turn-helix transcriptional regulator [Xanthomonas cannabis]NIK00617.1 transcriptional regulator with XRE-family HTH domain [Xanthomonas cannabis]NIK63252.1 transcriptional regulator with XRE-family HTH domain [Xanthomonas cannabis]